MFCKQCGNEMVDNAAICVKCGVATDLGMAQSRVREAPVVSSRSRALYIVLGFFLGGFGIHNFYAGRTKQGMTQLLLVVFFFWLILPLVIVGIWALIDICTVTEDGNGLPFS